MCLEMLIVCTINLSPTSKYVTGLELSNHGSLLKENFRPQNILGFVGLKNSLRLCRSPVWPAIIAGIFGQTVEVLSDAQV